MFWDEYRLRKEKEINGLQKVGGVAALIMAATFVMGIALLFTLLVPVGYFAADVDPVQNAAFLADNKTVMFVWYLTIYVVFGVFLVALALALYERLKVGSPAMAQTATAFGLIWAGLVIASGMVANIGADTVVELYGNDPTQAVSAWIALRIVIYGLGGGNEIVGGLWILLVSWAALRAEGISKPLNYFGLVISVAGIVTTVPALGELGAVFGLGSIVWFIWLGIVMLHSNPRAMAHV
jgi:hypothetical protein